MRTRRTRSRRYDGSSIGTAVVLMALGGVIAFAIRPPAEVSKYVDVLDLGLIVIWAGILILVMQVVMHRPPRVRRTSRGSAYDEELLPSQEDDHDVHRPGYAGETRRLPTVRRL